MKNQLEALINSLIENEIGFEDAVAEFQRRFIHKIMEKVNGNQSRAAKTLGIHRNTLSRKINELGLHDQPRRRKRVRR